MKKRTVKRVVFCVLIAAVLMLLLPFPQSVTRTLYGLDIHSGESAEIILDMKYLRFLFLEDRLKGQITVISGGKETSYGENLHYAGLWPLNHEDGTMHALGGFYMNEESYMHDYGDGVLGSRLVGPEPVQVYLSRSFDRIVLHHQPSAEAEKPAEREYVGQVEANKEEETGAYFAGFVSRR